MGSSPETLRLEFFAGLPLPKASVRSSTCKISRYDKALYGSLILGREGNTLLTGASLSIFGEVEAELVDLP